MGKSNFVYIQNQTTVYAIIKSRFFLGLNQLRKKRKRAGGSLYDSDDEDQEDCS
jgi:hypothetical protein